MLNNSNTSLQADNTKDRLQLKRYCFSSNNAMSMGSTLDDARQIFNHVRNSKSSKNEANEFVCDKTERSCHEQSINKANSANVRLKPPKFSSKSFKQKSSSDLNGTNTNHVNIRNSMSTEVQRLNSPNSDEESQNASLKTPSPVFCSGSNSSITSQNSKIDMVIGLPTTLFTTKYECIGTSKMGSDTNIRTNSPQSTHRKGSTNYSSLNPMSSNDTMRQQHSRISSAIKIKGKISSSMTSINAIYLNDTDTSDTNSNGTNRKANIDLKKIDANADNFDTNFFNVTDCIFLSTMSCIKNERKLCRLNIEYLVDMTNMRPDDLNRRILNKIPCACKIQHSRSYLSIQLIDKSFKNMFNTFIELNKFIQKARKKNRNILIFSTDISEHHVMCAIAQYLMLDYEMNLNNALKILSQKLFQSNMVTVEKCYLNYLKNFESYLQHLSIDLYKTSGDVISNDKSNKRKVYTNSEYYASSINKSNYSNSNDDLIAVSKVKTKIDCKEFTRFTEESYLETSTSELNNLKVAWI